MTHDTTTRRGRRVQPSAVITIACTLILLGAMLYAVQRLTTQRDNALAPVTQVATACADAAQRAALEENGVSCPAAEKVVEDADTSTEAVTGPRGPAGRDGRDGVDGSDGLPGLTGPPGRTGIPGVDGVPGAVGVDGQNGASGAPGSPGAAGVRGEVGDVGPTGPPGPQGPQGEQGRAGENGQDGATGPQGPEGAAGADGTALPGVYSCGDRQYLHGITITDTGAVDLDCRDLPSLLP